VCLCVSYDTWAWTNTRTHTHTQTRKSLHLNAAKCLLHGRIQAHTFRHGQRQTQAADTAAERQLQIQRQRDSCRQKRRRAGRETRDPRPRARIPEPETRSRKPTWYVYLRTMLSSKPPNLVNMSDTLPPLTYSKKMKSRLESSVCPTRYARVCERARARERERVRSHLRVQS
jgi:hypothetical protein